MADQKRPYDLVIIGTGSAASAAAFRCRAAGWRVAVIDSRPFGGTCALRGCHPKKMLVSAAEVIDATARMAGKGVRTHSVAIDWQELMRFKRSETGPAPQFFEQNFAGAGIEAFHGRARFVGPTAVAVGNDILEGQHVLVATGAMPAALPFPGAEHLTRSEQFLELEALPPRLLFVGGGYISFECAHVAVRAGADVTILHRGARPLQGFEPELVDQLVQRTRALGVHVELETEVQGIDKTSNGVRVRVHTAGRERHFEAEIAVHGAGRVPEIDDLDLEAAGIAYEKRGVTVNDYLQSVSNPAVYAAGDAVASGPPLTPTASHDGEVVAANLLQGNHRQPNYAGLASVVFTVPALALAGLTEETARAQGLQFRVHREDTSQWFSSLRLGETTSGFKVLVEEGSQRILGAHLFGPHAEEVINVFAVAVRFGIRAEDLKQVLFAYPTSASDVVHML
jgi:glutathione reductase (NADPH)